jgi:hypothetical protein
MSGRSKWNVILRNPIASHWVHSSPDPIKKDRKNLREISKRSKQRKEERKQKQKLANDDIQFFLSIVLVLQCCHAIISCYSTVLYCTVLYCTVLLSVIETAVVNDAFKYALVTERFVKLMIRSIEHLRMQCRMTRMSISVVT